MTTRAMHPFCPVLTNLAVWRIIERTMAPNITYSELPPPAYARIAGLLYLVIICAGIFGEAFVRGQLVVPADPAITLANIQASTALFLSGFVADSIMLLCDVALAVLLYFLLKPVDARLALLAMVFRLIQAAVLGVNLLGLVAIGLLVSGDFTGDADLGKRVLLLFELHAHGYDLGLLFFAVSNLILGYLIIRSGFLPALLGIGLQASAVVYLVGSYTRFLAPEWLSAVQPAYVVPLAAESALCLWLLFKGIDVQHKTP
jgi:hypothetical protein